MSYATEPTGRDDVTLCRVAMRRYNESAAVAFVNQGYAKAAPVILAVYPVDDWTAVAVEWIPGIGVDDDRAPRRDLLAELAQTAHLFHVERDDDLDEDELTREAGLADLLDELPEV